MSSRSGRGNGTWLLALIAVLWGGLAVALGTRRSVPSAGARFQRATSGFGLLAGRSPDWCFFTIDLRIARSCENELGPLPGFACYCPSHGAAAAARAPIEPGRRH